MDSSYTVPEEVSRKISVINDVLEEREAQNAKWGEQNHPDGTGPQGFHEHIVGVADRYRMETNNAANDGTLTFRHILLEEVFEAVAEDDPAKLREELVQVAAVCVQWVEKLDRHAEAV